MVNIFQKIGNNIEREKKRREIFEKKYWKLSSSERMEYDLKKQKIKDHHFGGYITVEIAKILSVVIIFLATFGFATGKLFVAIPAIKTLFIFYFSYLTYFLLVDVILLVISNHQYDKKIKELKKRFKLC